MSEEIPTQNPPEPEASSADVEPAPQPIPLEIETEPPKQTESKQTKQDKIFIAFYCYTLFTCSSFKCFSHINTFLFDPTSSFQATQASNILYFISMYIGRFLSSKTSPFKTTSFLFIALTISNLLLLIFNINTHLINSLSLLIYSSVSSLPFFTILRHVWRLYPFNKGLATAIIIAIDLCGNAFFVMLYQLIKVKRLYFLVVTVLCVGGIIGSVYLYKKTHMKTIKEYYKKLNMKNDDMDLNKSFNTEIDHYSKNETDSSTYLSLSKQEDNMNPFVLKAKQYYFHTQMYMNHLHKHLFNKKYTYIISSLSLISTSTYIISISYISYYLISFTQFQLNPISQYIHYVYYISAIVFCLCLGMLYDLRGFRRRLGYASVGQCVAIVALCLFGRFGVGAVYVACLLNAGALAGVRCLFIPMIYKEIGEEGGIDGIGVGLLVVSGIEYVSAMFMKEVVYERGIFNFVYFGCFMMSVLSIVIVYVKIHPMNRFDVKDGEKSRKEWIEQDKLRELRKE